MEYYRRGARDVRKVAQKLVKSDTNNGVVSTNEASSEGSAVRVFDVLFVSSNYLTCGFYRLITKLSK